MQRIYVVQSRFLDSRFKLQNTTHRQLKRSVLPWSGSCKHSALSSAGAFLFLTDHNSLQCSSNVSGTCGQLIRMRLPLLKFVFKFRFKKGTGKRQADALSRVRTNAEVGISTAKLYIPNFEASDVSSCDFIHSKFDTDNPATHTVRKKQEFSYTSIELLMLIQEQLPDLFCRQIQERLKRAIAYRFKLESTDF